MGITLWNPLLTKCSISSINKTVIARLKVVNEGLHETVSTWKLDFDLWDIVCVTVFKEFLK